MTSVLKLVFYGRECMDQYSQNVYTHLQLRSLLPSARRLRIWYTSRRASGVALLISMKKNAFSGTLFLLILRILKTGPLHGYAIGHRITERSKNRLQIEQGSLYPALRRMVGKGWIKGSWQVSSTGRRIRAYTLTEKGIKELERQSTEVVGLMQGINSILKHA